MHRRSSTSTTPGQLHRLAILVQDHPPLPKDIHSVFLLVHWYGLPTHTLLHCHRLLRCQRHHQCSIRLHLHRHLCHWCRDVHRHRLLTTRTPPPPQQPIHQVGVGRSTGYFILGLRSLHPVRIASRNGVLLLGHRCRGPRTYLYDWPHGSFLTQSTPMNHT